MSWWLCPPEKFAERQRTREAEMRSETPPKAVQQYLDQIETWDERENLGLPTPRTMAQVAPGR